MMRILAWLGIGLGALVAVVVAAVFGLISYVQNNDMAGWAAWGAEKAGIPATFGGPLTVQLRPNLLVRAQEVTIGGAHGMAKVAELPAIAVQADWGYGLRFWEGLQLRAVEAQRPSVTLVRAENGLANWEFATPVDEAVAEAANPVEDVQEAQNPLAELTRQGGILAALRLAVQDLNLTYRDETNGQDVLVRNMTISADTEGTVATTQLRGTINGQALKGDVVADVARLDDIPVKARLEGAQAMVALDGRIRQPTTGAPGFAGLINARSSNLKATVQTLAGIAPAEIPAQAASVNGDVVLGQEAVVLRNFAARLGELLQARGDVEIALGETPSGAGQIRVQGENLRALAELVLRTPQPMLPARPFNLNTRLAGENAIALSDLTFQLEPVLTVRGDITLTPQTGQTMPDLRTELAIQSRNLDGLLEAFGQGALTAPQAPLNGTIRLVGEGGILTLSEVQARVPEVVAVQATGQVNLREATPVLDVEATASGDNMARTAAGFGITEGLPESAFSARARIRGAGPYEVEGLTLNLPGLVQALANFTYAPGAPANVQGDVNISQLHLTRLGYCSPAQGGGGAAGAGGAGGGGGAPWSQEPLDLSALRQLAMNVTVQANGLTCGDLPLERVGMAVRNTPSQLDVTDLLLGFGEAGNLTGTLTLVHAGTPRLTTDLRLAQVDVQRFVPPLAAQGVRLPLTGRLELASRGETTLALAQALNGRIELAANEGQLPYENLLGNVVALERLLAGQLPVAGNGNGEVEEFAATLVLRDGLGTFETLRAATANNALTLTGSGTVDLPNWTIDLRLVPTLATTQGLEVPVLVRGPLTSPAIGADPDFIQKVTARLASEGIQGLLGLKKEDTQGLGGLVGDVLSGQGVSRENVGNLLNQFVRPRNQPSPTAPEAASPSAPAAASPTAETPAEERPAEPASPTAAPRTPEETLRNAVPGLLQGILGQ